MQTKTKKWDKLCIGEDEENVYPSTAGAVDELHNTNITAYIKYFGI